LNDFEEGRKKAMVDSFQYGSGMTMDELIEIHVPSSIFPNKTAVEFTLNQCVLDGMLLVDNRGRYRKPI
jgi:hypothetical protein